jgi:hypothetical protein
VSQSQILRELEHRNYFFMVISYWDFDVRF